MDERSRILGLYAEVALAFVAFSAIVATLRQTTGDHFTPLQYVMFRFFIECGMIYVIIAVVSLGIHKVFPDEQLAWRLVNYYALANLLFYLPLHIRRRRKLGVKMPNVSVIVILGYLILGIILLVTATELFWQPSIVTVTLLLIWGLLGNTLIFIHFIESFVHLEPAE
jgi:hypothetical protein